MASPHAILCYATLHADKRNLRKQENKCILGITYYAYVRSDASICIVRLEASNAGIFLLANTSRSAMGPIKPPIQWVPWVLYTGIITPGCEGDNLPSSSAEVKNAWTWNSSPPIRLHGAVIKEWIYPHDLVLS
jgi:hypothetical protein